MEAVIVVYGLGVISGLVLSLFIEAHLERRKRRERGW